MKDRHLNFLKKGLAKGKLDEVISRLFSLYLPEHYEEQLILLSARNHDLKRKSIKGIISTNEYSIERNQLNSSVLSFIYSIDSDEKMESFDWLFNIREYKLSYEIMTVAENLFFIKKETKKPLKSISDSGHDLLLRIQKVIDNIANDIKGREISYIDQGKIFAIAENLYNLLSGEVAESIIKNLSNSLTEIREAETIYLESDDSNKEEAIQVLKTTQGYLSALIELSKKA